MQLDLFPEMGQTPVWTALLTLCKRYGTLHAFRQYGYDGILDIDDFMWMHSWGELQCYKHRNTRRYLNIDKAGNFYRYSTKYGTYDKISTYEAFKSLFG